MKSKVSKQSLRARLTRAAWLGLRPFTFVSPQKRMNPFFYRSPVGTYQSQVLLPNSANCKLVDLLCHVKVGGGNVFLLLYDSYTNATPGTDEGSLLGVSGLSTTNGRDDWTVGTKVMFSNSGGALPVNLTEGVIYYLSPQGGNDEFLIYATLTDALAGTNPIDVSDEGTGTHSTHFLNWIEFTPIPIADGATEGPHWDALMGREFKEGILAVLSTSDTGAVPVSAVGFFDAAYTR